MSTVTVTTQFDTSVDKVWSALTNKLEMEAWYFHIPEFELKEGAVFTFYETPENGQFLHRCEILKVVPNKLLEHTWEHPSHSKGRSTVKWELKELKDDKTQLTLTHTGLENFADGGQFFAEENYEAGWKHIIKVALRNHLYGIVKLKFDIDIQASAEKVWHTLWDRESYDRWTDPFSIESTYAGSMEKGGRVHFLGEGNNGMYTDVLHFEPFKHVIFSHIGMVADGKEMPIDDTTSKWSGNIEEYVLTETSDGVKLHVEVDVDAEWIEDMQKSFPLALKEVKIMAEK